MVTIQRARFAAYYRNPIRGCLHADNLDGDFGLRSASVRAKRTSTGCPAPHTLGQRVFFKYAKLAPVQKQLQRDSTYHENLMILLKMLSTVIHIVLPIGSYMNTILRKGNMKFYGKTEKRTRNNLHAPHQSPAYRCSI